MPQLSALYPRPILRLPPLWITIATGVDELLIPRIGDVLRLDRKRRHINRKRRMFVVPSKWDRGAIDAERCTTGRDSNPFGSRHCALRHRGISVRAMFL